MLALVILTLFSIVILYLGFSRNKHYIIPLSIVGVLAAMVSIATDQALWNEYLQNMLSVSGIPKILNLCLLGTSLCILPFFGVYKYRGNEEIADYIGLLLFALVGGILMMGYFNLILLFVGIEIVSIAMYILAGANRRNILSNEAAVKYFIMGAFSSAILLFGFSLFYVSTGSLVVSTHTLVGMNGMYAIAVVFIMVGLSFKLALVPFHYWAPDVYQGSPTLFTTVMATIVKIAAFGAMYRFIILANDQMPDWLMWLISLLVLCTLFLGNIMAYTQSSVKRLLAYSGIVQAGFIAMGLIHIKIGNEWPFVFYLIAYTLSTIVTFLVVHFVEKQSGSDHLDSFAGLGFSNPMLAGVMTVALISLSGAPLTAGFMAKFFVLNQAAHQGLISLVVIAVVMAICSMYYYYKIINAMYFGTSGDATWRIHWLFQGILVLLSILTFIFGIVPSLVTQWIAAS